MATVRIGSAAPVDMRSANTVFGTARIATSTQIEIVAGSFVGDYFGRGFTYSPNGAVVGGTLTGYSQTFNGGLVVTATGLDVAAATAYQLIQSNNDIQLEATALSGDDTIFGAGDSDVLVGFGGNNSIIGVHVGVDYAAYSGVASAFPITVNPYGFVVSRPDGGQDLLINIKAILFSDQTVSLSNPDFDASYYLSHNPDVAQAGVDPLAHYLTTGWKEGRDPNAVLQHQILRKPKSGCRGGGD